MPAWFPANPTRWHPCSTSRTSPPCRLQIPRLRLRTSDAPPMHQQTPGWFANLAKNTKPWAMNVRGAYNKAD